MPHTVGWCESKGEREVIENVDLPCSRQGMAWPPGDADDAPGMVGRDLGGCERRWLARSSAGPRG